MKAENVHAAAILVEAHSDFSTLQKAMERTEPKSGYTRLVLCISVESVSEDGGETHAEIQIDMESAKRLVPKVASLIRDRLAEIGVEIE